MKANKDTYIKNKTIDYNLIEKLSSLPSIRVTGPCVVPGESPQGIEFTEERLQQMLLRDQYIDSEAVDAVLSLIDRKLSEDC